MNKTPCPYCNAPLASPRAKQCLHCHWDWHDPANPHQIDVDPNWNRFGLNPEKTYVVELCQTSSGGRYTRYREVPDGVGDPCAVLETTPASGKLFVEWGFYAYSAHLKLSNGQSFGFEAHGIWLTDTEIAYLGNDLVPEGVNTSPWVNGIPPNFPPC